MRTPTSLASRPKPIAWRLATVADVVRETSRARTLVLDVPGWPGHRAGQHVDVRVTAEDGYQAQRSYSIASAPEDARLAHATPGPPAPGGFVTPRELEPEHRRVYDAAVRGYLALFGSTPVTLADDAFDPWETRIPALDVRLVGSIGLPFVRPDGDGRCMHVGGEEGKGGQRDMEQGMQQAQAQASQDARPPGSATH